VHNGQTASSCTRPRLRPSMPARRTDVVSHHRPAGVTTEPNWDR
jgi:hypothetical protein